jgi:hypothetical protein
MASHAGQLDLIDIGAIFVVVFLAIAGVVQFSEGELLPPDTTDEREDRLRAAVWQELDERRITQERDPMPRDRFIRGIAQDTTDTLLEDWPDGDTSGFPGRPNATLPNHRLFCTQLPVRVRVGNVSSPPSEATVTAVADAIAAADEDDVRFRPATRFRAGMGIAVRDGIVYVVYRSCEQVDT